jgi:hypothetical protein
MGSAACLAVVVSQSPSRRAVEEEGRIVDGIKYKIMIPCNLHLPDFFFLLLLTLRYTAKGGINGCWDGVGCFLFSFFSFRFCFCDGQVGEETLCIGLVS